MFLFDFLLAKVFYICASFHPRCHWLKTAGGEGVRVENKNTVVSFFAENVNFLALRVLKLPRKKRTTPSPIVPKTGKKIVLRTLYL